MNRRALAAGLALALCSGTALSQQTVCRFSSAGSLGFGTYDSLGTAARTSQTNILVRCDRNGGPANVDIAVGLGPGSNSPSTVARKLVASGKPTPLLYDLFQDSGHTLHWGNVAGVDTATRRITIPNKSFAAATFTVYGRIPAQQDVYAGSYSDSIQVTLTP